MIRSGHTHTKNQQLKSAGKCDVRDRERQFCTAFPLRSSPLRFRRLLAVKTLRSDVAQCSEWAGTQVSLEEILGYTQ